MQKKKKQVIMLTFTFHLRGSDRKLHGGKSETGQTAASVASWSANPGLAASRSPLPSETSVWACWGCKYKPHTDGG